MLPGMRSGAASPEKAIVAFSIRRRQGRTGTSRPGAPARILDISTTHSVNVIATEAHETIYARFRDDFA